MKLMSNVENDACILHATYKNVEGLTGLFKINRVYQELTIEKLANGVKNFKIEVFYIYIYFRLHLCLCKTSNRNKR